MSINRKVTAITIRNHGARVLSVTVAAFCTAGIGMGFQSYFDYKQHRAPGWHTDENGTYYIMRTTKSRATGLKLINNTSYLFDADGVMQTGWQTFDGNTYYFDESGVMQKGVVQIDGEEYYLSDESGIFKTGLQDFNGEQFYFDDHGKPNTGLDTEGGYYYNEFGKRTTGWVNINGIQYYFFKSGENEGKMAKGWTDIKDTDTGETYTYYFGLDGHMYTGRNTIEGVLYDFQDSGVLFKGWGVDGRKYYHADEKTGIFSIGFEEIDGSIYYFDQDYSMVTGWKTIGDHLYRFDDDGTMLTGWYYENLQAYYFLEDGTAASGFLKLDYDYYYFDPESFKLCYGWAKIDNELYYFGDDGKVWQGFYNYKGNYYFFDQETHKAVKGLFKTIPYTDEQKKVIKEFRSDIEKLDEFLDTKERKKIPDYPDDIINEGDEKAAEKKQKIDSEKQAFRTAVLAAGYTEEEEKEIEDIYKNYMCGSYYKSLELSAYDKLGEKLFAQHYFNDDGFVQTGWQTIQGIKFYFDPLTAEKVTGWKEIDGHKYYFGDLGVCAVGKLNVKGQNYDFGSSGYLPAGIYKVGSKIKYLIGDNQYAINYFARENGKLYYFGSDGYAVTGWQVIDGKEYLFGTNFTLSTGWQKRDDNKKVFVTESGVLKNTWYNESSGTYYLDKNGNPVSGWNTIDGMDFYFTSDGKLKSGWTQIDGKDYYLDHGAVVRGVFSDSTGDTFIIGADGYLVGDCWVYWNGDQYYADENGSPIVDAIQKIDDEIYVFDYYGVATKLV